MDRKGEQWRGDGGLWIDKWGSDNGLQLIFLVLSI